jgi:hypothetical protein
MKTKKTILYGALAVIFSLVLALAFTACDDDDDEAGGGGGTGGGTGGTGVGGGGNTDPKTLNIEIWTGVLSNGTVTFFVGVYTAGTPLPDAIVYSSNKEGFVAAAYKSAHGVTFNNDDSTFTAPLYTSADVRWTGSGTYDIYVMLTQNSVSSLYRVTAVNISSATTSITISMPTKVK